MARLLLLTAVLMCAACSTEPPAATGPATAELPVSDIVQPKLAPQTGIDPTVSEPLVQRRCDFALDLTVDKSWFAGNMLTPDGRIALARSVLGPSAECRRVELLSVTMQADGVPDANRAKADAEHRVEQIRQFFASHGIAAERIEARADQAAPGRAVRVAVHARRLTWRSTFAAWHAESR